MTENPSPFPASPPRKKRRAVFWGIIAIALVAVAACAYYPEHVITPFRVMPDECVIVTENLRLAEKWRERISNPAVLATMRFCGVDDPREIADDAQLETILELLCGKRTVLGMVPELGDAGLPAFTGASYVGPRLLPLRLLILFKHVPGIGPIHRTELGTMYLDFEEDDESDHEVLSIDLREGVLLAAWSLDKDAVRALSSRLEGKAEPAPIFEGDTPWRNPLDTPMRAWIDRDFLDFPEELNPVSNMRVEAIKWDADIFDAKIRESMPSPSDDAGGLPVLAKSCAALDMLPDAPPIAVAVLPGALVVGQLSSGMSGDFEDIRVVATYGDACAVLTRQDMGGKIMGIPIPALQLTLPWQMPRQIVAKALFKNLLSGSERANGQGANGTRTLIDIPDISLVRTPDSDCVAIDSFQDWIAITTSAAVADNMRASPIDGTAPWRKGWRDAYAKKEPIMYFWADLASIASEAQRLLSVYRLAATFIPDLNDPETSSQVNNIVVTLGELAMAKQLELSAEYKADGTERRTKPIEVSLRLGSVPLKR